MSDEPEKDKSFEILLESYKGIREEIKLTQQLQQNILSWTSVSVGVLLIFAYNLWQKSILYTFIFFLFIFPSTSYMYLNIWLAEVSKMMRGSRYLFSIEDHFRKFSQKDTHSLFYEHWIRNEKHSKSNKHFLFGYLSGIAIYFGIIVFCHIISIVILWKHDEMLNELGFSNCHIFLIKFILFCAIISFNLFLIFHTKKRVELYVK